MAEGPADGTFAHEALLPRVPLPTLEDSAARFLTWCSPLLTPDELAATEQAVASFLAPDSPAHALQAALEAYDARPTSTAGSTTSGDSATSGGATGSR